MYRGWSETPLAYGILVLVNQTGIEAEVEGGSVLNMDLGEPSETVVESMSGRIKRLLKYSMYVLCWTRGNNNN